MRRFLLLLIALLCIVASSAEDFTFLTIVEQDGTKTSLTAVGLSISFGEETMTASNAYTGESMTLALSNLASMNFSDHDETTGISHTKTDDDISISNADAIYTLQGQQLPSGVLPSKGLYILKKGKLIRKIQVR